tara:strand:- start:114 stop:683 length:570 start_codon:yes stop_codon:yes gene_type:complete
MRIISGKLKGNSLYLPKDKKIRPLKDIARESIFNLLIHSNKIFFQFNQSCVLDLYAGTGSFGLECISRQAKNVYFVEKEKNALSILKKNIEKLKVKNKTTVFLDDAIELIRKSNISSTKFDLIFCDPPFKDEKINRLIEVIYNKNILQKNGILVIHRKKSIRDKFPDCLKIIDERIYGISKIVFGKFLG